ncbi:MAG TPA: GNAT family protein [Gammaproteobacteria bacterium]|nr:GNAT family protein [Gammaproteobacteria bacterium]
MDAAFPGLATERCALRPLASHDLPEFAAYRALPEVARFQSWSDYAPADAERLLVRQQATPFAAPESWFQIAVTARDGSALFGDCALHFPADPRQLEIGFTLAPRHQGQGLMREALACLLNHVFGVMQRHRVTAVTDADNQPARRLLIALGFRLEAHCVENVFFKGRWSDECLYACLAREWRGL